VARLARLATLALLVCVLGAVLLRSLGPRQETVAAWTLVAVRNDGMTLDIRVNVRDSLWANCDRYESTVGRGSADRLSVIVTTSTGVVGVCEDRDDRTYEVIEIRLRQPLEGRVLAGCQDRDCRGIIPSDRDKWPIIDVVVET
jgi:hypothetical protein